ncbi:MAG: hypothetical protein IPG53_23605 [Ignavibacteriales bacterium]|nr:hypothetical protein [Ignavibacteriales bacterium]
MEIWYGRFFRIAWTAGDVKIIPYHSRGWQWAYITTETQNTTAQAKR